MGGGGEHPAAVDTLGSIRMELWCPIFDIATDATALTNRGSRANAGEAPIDSDGASCSGRFGGDGGRRGSSRGGYEAAGAAPAIAVLTSASSKSHPYCLCAALGSSERNEPQHMCTHWRICVALMTRW